MNPLETTYTIHVNAGNDFEHFAQILGGTDIRLGSSCESETGLIFSAYSRHLDCCNSHEERIARIYSLEVFLNGARRLSLDDWADLSPDGSSPTPISFYAFDDGFLTHKVAPVGFDDYPFCTAPSPIIHGDLAMFCNPDRHMVSQLIERSKRCQYIRSLLIYAGLIQTTHVVDRINSWNLLYKIYDTINTAVKASIPKINLVPDLISNNDLKLFTGSCNTVSTLGIYSRHGLTSHTKPKASISDFSEACSIIFPLCHRFLKHHLRS